MKWGNILSGGDLIRVVFHRLRGTARWGPVENDDLPVRAPRGVRRAYFRVKSRV